LGHLTEEISMDIRLTLVTAVVAGLTFSASIGLGQTREYHSRLQALHHLQHGPRGHGYGYATEYAEPSAGPTRNWYEPGEYDRLMNGSDASTPGHN
jgi:hypothetical protein